jgi:ferredoxin
MSRIRLHINPISCDGFGMCQELLPELLELDDWGYPMVREGTVPLRLMDHARRAVKVCPKVALTLETDPT